MLTRTGALASSMALLVLFGPMPTSAHQPCNHEATIEYTATTVRVSLVLDLAACEDSGRYGTNFGEFRAYGYLSREYHHEMTTDIRCPARSACTLELSSGHPSEEMAHYLVQAVFEPAQELRFGLVWQWEDDCISQSGHAVCPVTVLDELQHIHTP